MLLSQALKNCLFGKQLRQTCTVRLYLGLVCAASDLKQTRGSSPSKVHIQMRVKGNYKSVAGAVARIGAVTNTYTILI